MNNFLRFLGFMLGLLFVAAIAYGMYTGFFSLAEWLSGGLGDMTVFLLSVGGIMIMCAWIISSAIRSTAKRHKPANPDKMALYTRFIETISEGEKADFSVFEKYLLLWGSNRLVAQYARLQTLLEANPFESKVIAAHLTRMIKEIRRDLGESNIGLTEKMIVNSILNSPAQPARQEERTKEPVIS